MFAGFFGILSAINLWRHGTEHGAAWFTWRDGLTADEQAFIDGMAKKSQWILASPYPEQASPFTLTAWPRAPDDAVRVTIQPLGEGERRVTIF